jgi:hypothetical protein
LHPIGGTGNTQEDCILVRNLHHRYKSSNCVFPLFRDSSVFIPRAPYFAPYGPIFAIVSASKPGSQAEMIYEKTRQKKISCNCPCKKCNCNHAMISLQPVHSLMCLTVQYAESCMFIYGGNSINKCSAMSVNFNSWHYLYSPSCTLLSSAIS